MKFLICIFFALTLSFNTRAGGRLGILSDTAGASNNLDLAIGLGTGLIQSPNPYSTYLHILPRLGLFFPSIKLAGTPSAFNRSGVNMSGVNMVEASLHFMIFGYGKSSLGNFFNINIPLPIKGTSQIVNVEFGWFTGIEGFIPKASIGYLYHFE